jgi:integrase
VDFRLPRQLASKYNCKRFRRSYKLKAVANGVHAAIYRAISNRDKDGELAKLLDAEQSGYTIQTFYDRWIKEYVTPRLEASTKKRYELSFKTINEYGGTVAISSYGRQDLHRYIQSRTGKVSASTINKDIIAIKKMFSFAFEVGAIDNNLLLRFPVLRVQEKALRLPTWDEFVCLVDAMKDPAISAMVAVIGEAGIRRSEAINLEWKHVNLRTVRLTLEKTKGKRVRYLPLSEYAVEKLRGLQRFVHQPFVFCHQISGDRWLSPDKYFRAGRKKACLDWVTFHTLRHFWVTRMIKGGANIEAVKEGAGHLDIKTTDRYAKHAKNESERVLRETIEKEKAKGQKRDKLKGE